MFELSIACKYLRPRWRQLSVSIISLISILVISLVVWLIVVFFSVTNGLEKRWVDKLIALTAPIRITPTQAYYDSYYHQVDSISSQSNYSLKTIGEKLKSSESNPYDPHSDMEVPADWLSPDNNSDGTLKDPVKKAFAIIESIPGLKAKAYEASAGNIRLRLVRKSETTPPVLTQAFLNQSTFLGSLDNENSAILKTVLPISQNDINNLLLNTEQNNKISKENISKYLKNNLTSAQTNFEKEPDSIPLWLYHIKNSQTQTIHLPISKELGEGILLPRTYRDAGVLIGDQGFISFSTPTASTMQEQRIKIFVAGFYDQGLIPIGGKFIIVNEGVTDLMSGAQHDQQTQSNGINVRFVDLGKTSEIKAKLQKAFEEAGIANYWKIETYKEFDFTKDIMQQLNSDKHLFTLIATVIIIVACSNIISMLIILVNDKKLEIGILRSMGATSTSIAIIFGFCGIVMGITGSMVGIAAALLTLRYLDSLVGLLSAVQGHDAFNPIYYGDKLPNEISLEALLYVVTATAAISLLSGLVPALKASLLRPSTILRAE